MSSWSLADRTLAVPTAGGHRRIAPSHLGLSSVQPDAYPTSSRGYASRVPPNHSHNRSRPPPASAVRGRFIVWRHFPRSGMPTTGSRPVLREALARDRCRGVASHSSTRFGLSDPVRQASSTPRRCVGPSNRQLSFLLRKGRGLGPLRPRMEVRHGVATQPQGSRSPMLPRFKAVLYSYSREQK